MRNIRQNLFFAFIYNAVGILIAGAAMSLSSVSVITTALHLKAVKL